MRALGSSGEAGLVLDALKWGLSDVDPQVRREAALSLGKLGERTTTGSLVNVLGDLEPIVREGAAKALGLLGDASPRVVDSLKTIATDASESPQVRDAALDALADLAVPGIASMYEDLLSDGEPRVRVKSMAGLVASRDSGAVTSLVPLLGDPDPRVRVEAVRHLGSFLTGGHEAGLVKHLVPLLGDEKEEVRVAAIEVVAKTGDPGVREPLLGVVESGPPAVANKARAALRTLAEAEKLNAERGLGEEMDAEIQKVEGEIAGLEERVRNLQGEIAEKHAEIKRIEDEYREKIARAKRSIEDRYSK
ncbi:MAG: HEAT repeat domain-containing protein [Promethearchaeota archaeon]